MKNLLEKIQFKGYMGNRKVRLGLLAVLFTVILCVFVTATLHASTSYVPEDTVQELNYKRSQVFVDGTGYSMDNYRKEQHKEEEYQRDIETMPDNPQEQKEEEPKKPTDPPKYTPTTPTNRYTPRSYSSNRYRLNRNQNQNNNKKKTNKKTKEKKTEYEKKKKKANEDPTISVSGIKNGETIKGKTVSFTVTAMTYDGDEITGSDLTVTLNGTKLSGSGNKYKGDVEDGSNKIVITAKDGKKEKTKTIKFTGDTEEEPEVIGKITVSVTADVLELGTVVPSKKVEVRRGEMLSDVVNRYFKSSSGVTVVTKDKYVITRIKKDGILDGIPEEKAAELEEQGTPVPDDKDSLGDKDFGSGSGWMYSVDGDTPDEYLYEKEAEPGTTVEIFYTM